MFASFLHWGMLHWVYNYPLWNITFILTVIMLFETPPYFLHSSTLSSLNRTCSELWCPPSCKTLLALSFLHTFKERKGLSATHKCEYSSAQRGRHGGRRCCHGWLAPLLHISVELEAESRGSALSSFLPLYSLGLQSMDSALGWSGLSTSVDLFRIVFTGTPLRRLQIQQVASEVWPS